MDIIRVQDPAGVFESYRKRRSRDEDIGLFEREVRDCLAVRRSQLGSGFESSKGESDATGAP